MSCQHCFVFVSLLLLITPVCAQHAGTVHKWAISLTVAILGIIIAAIIFVIAYFFCCKTWVRDYREKNGMSYVEKGRDPSGGPYPPSQQVQYRNGPNPPMRDDYQQKTSYEPRQNYRSEPAVENYGSEPMVTIGGSNRTSSNFEPYQKSGGNTPSQLSVSRLSQQNYNYETEPSTTVTRYGQSTVNDQAGGVGQSSYQRTTTTTTTNKQQMVSAAFAGSAV